jgi:hypothetical protein
MLVLMAVIRHMQRESGPPANLEAIAATLRAPEAEDPFTGKPWHYDRTGATFTLASVGKDLIDDRGDPERDLVFWPPKAGKDRTGGTPAPSRRGIDLLTGGH